MSRRTLTFKVEILLDRDASQADALKYIQEAVQAWGGQRRPDDPFFGLQEEDVQVTVWRKPAVKAEGAPR